MHVVFPNEYLVMFKLQDLSIASTSTERSYTFSFKGTSYKLTLSNLLDMLLTKTEMES